MKLLINASNLYVGGGVQVAVSFINELKYIKNRNKYFIFLSPILKNQLDINQFDNRFKFYLIENSPASLKNRLNIVKKMSLLEKDINPDIVFTIFGPSYWRSKNVHLMGFADGWVYYSQSIAYKQLPLLKKIKVKILNKYKKFYLQRDAEYFVLETDDAKKHFCKKLNVESKKVFVVGNTHNSVFEDKNLLDIENKNYIKLSESKKFRILYIAHNYSHKNIFILDKVLNYLKDDVEFVLTLSESDYNKFINKKNIINVGKVNLKQCPSLYYQCDAVISTSLLETFSAIYPEAMKMKKPILTSNYSFAKEICGDAALYFDPLNPIDIANKIKKLKEDELLRQELIKRGIKRLENFVTARSRAEKYLKICEKIVKGIL